MYAKVLLRQSGSKDRIFDYSVPAEMASDGLLGMRVAVPLGRGNHVREGFVIALSEESSVESEKLKPILRCADKSAVFSPELLKTAEWMAKKYQTTLASALRLMKRLKALRKLSLSETSPLSKLSLRLPLLWL